MLSLPTQRQESDAPCLEKGRGSGAELPALLLIGVLPVVRRPRLLRTQAGQLLAAPLLLQTDRGWEKNRRSESPRFSSFVLALIWGLHGRRLLFHSRRRYARNPCSVGDIVAARMSAHQKRLRKAGCCGDRRQQGSMKDWLWVTPKRPDDGRATFEYGAEVRSGEPHVIWRCIGTYSVSSARHDYHRYVTRESASAGDLRLPGPLDWLRGGSYR